MNTCDSCGKKRRDVKSVGRDSNGDPDAPDMCFVCRKELDRGRVWNDKVQGYVPRGVNDDDVKRADVAGPRERGRIRIPR